jgi:hypothetical protein
VSRCVAGLRRKRDEHCGDGTGKPTGEQRFPAR